MAALPGVREGRSLFTDLVGSRRPHRSFSAFRPWWKKRWHRSAADAFCSGGWSKLLGILARLGRRRGQPWQLRLRLERVKVAKGVGPRSRSVWCLISRTGPRGWQYALLERRSEVEAAEVKWKPAFTKSPRPPRQPAARSRGLSGACHRVWAGMQQRGGQPARREPRRHRVDPRGLKLLLRRE